MKFTSILSIVAFIVTANAATVSTLLNDIAVIGSGASRIDALVQAYPETNGTVAGAQDIHSAVAGLVTPIKIATADAQAIVPVVAPYHVSDEEARRIADAVNHIRIPIRLPIPRLVVLRPTFAALPVEGIPAVILQDLVALNLAMEAFRESVDAMVPKSFLDQTEDFFQAVVSDFNAAITAYSD